MDMRSRPVSQRLPTTMLNKRSYKNMSRASFAQFFTTSPQICAVVETFLQSGCVQNVLEPGAGRGDLVRLIQAKHPSSFIDAIEIDKELVPIDQARQSKYVQWIYHDFLKWPTTKFYDLIIGNPPYRRSSQGCKQILFVEKAFDLLKTHGEMIMIVPSDFFRLTQAACILKRMLNDGHFTHVHMMHDELLFDGARIDTLVFRYQRTTGLGTTTLLNGKTVSLLASNGIVTFGVDATAEMIRLGDVCDIKVGLVSGCEAVFKDAALGNEEILIKKNQRLKYILVDSLTDPVIAARLSQFKTVLLDRRIRKCTEKDWFKWGALRNYEFMKGSRAGSPCIYMYLLTRGNEPCFTGKVQLFGSRLLCVAPKIGRHLDLTILKDYFNSKEFRGRYTHAGRFKIGQRQLCNALVPQSRIIATDI